MSADPSGVAVSNPANPQNWNLYSYVQNNPLSAVDPDGRQCVWDDGSYDSADDPQTGSVEGCTNAGGTYFDPSTFHETASLQGPNDDWSASPNSFLAGQVADVQALQDSPPTMPGANQATWGNTFMSGMTTTINFGGLNWFTSQVSTGTHPFRDNNPGDIENGLFTSSNGAIGADGRFAVFSTVGTGNNALGSLLSGPAYSNLTLNQAVSQYAPAFENNTAGYQQVLMNVVGVSGNTPLSSLSPSQFPALENGIARYEGFNAAGKLEGRLIKRKVFGPPGYGETPARDERDTILILKLPHPITVEPLPGVVAKSDPNAETFKHVLEVQLFVSHDMASDAEKMVGKLVAATGVLNEHVAPSDYTDVWMAVKAINPK